MRRALTAAGFLRAVAVIWCLAATSGLAAEAPKPPPGPSASPPKGHKPSPPPAHAHPRYVPGWSPFVPYSPWYEPYGVVPYYVPYAEGPIILPPLYIPGETMFGPQVMRRFMGVDAGQPFGAQPGNPPRDREPSRDDEQDRRGALRGTSPEAVALARRFIGFGDAQFAKQKYADALDRYKRASQSAPGLADAWFRQAYAHVAVGRYAQAANALRQGLRLDPGWPRSGFTNRQIYGDNHAAELAHLDGLAQAAEKDPDNPDLLFLVGVWLHFGGQRDRAAVFFQRVAQLIPGQSDHVQPFLR
ncbi:MAG: tetratricopeptide repeat protein [Thermoguttaceae bacterium]|nr:tetratricopeptide repeat protein [Thermoguttaceae bacterium]